MIRPHKFFPIFKETMNKSAKKTKKVSTLTSAAHSSHNSTFETKKPSELIKILPMPSNIHDYIDDMLEITTRNIEAEYLKMKNY